jgi:riboflavin-specific deaminase-like protein
VDHRPEARADGHAWRARACAILTGIGTVKADDPQLTVRGSTRRASRAASSSTASSRSPPGARILQGGRAGSWRRWPNPAKEAALRAAGHEVIMLPNAAGKVDLPALMRELGRREINELHVEAGSKLNGSLVREGCVDELLVYLAPSLIGDGAGHVRAAAADRDLLGQVAQVGPDRAALPRACSRSAPICASLRDSLNKRITVCLLESSPPSAKSIGQAARRRLVRGRAPGHRRRRPAAGRRRAGRLDRHQRRLHDGGREDRYQLQRRRLARKPELHRGPRRSRAK